MSKAIGALLVAVFSATLALPVPQETAAPRTPGRAPHADNPGVSVDENVSYGNVKGAALLLDVYKAALPGADVIYTAHSIPVSMAQSSPYEAELQEASRRVNERLGLGAPTLVYQSRSGPPTQPWLEPDIGDYIRRTESKRLVVAPIVVPASLTWAAR